MFSDIKNAIINFISHRLFALTVLFFVLFGILVYRLFSLQIINGQSYLDSFTLISKKTITTNGQRGNIYDCNGNLLAYNRLTYSLTFSNDTTIDTIATQENVTSNEVKNDVIYRLLQILDKNGDSIVNSFEIKLNKKGEFVFTSTNENTILAFKREVYSRSTVDDLTQEEQDATASDVMDYLKTSDMFGISDEYEDKVALKIAAIRYMLYLNRYNQYVPVTIARDISDESVAAIKEDTNDLPGADIETDSVREYNYSPYFSQIIGYTGVISEEEKDTLNKDLDEDEQYSGNEVIGKTGLEQEFEDVLRGQNGSKTVLVDSVGQILQTNDDEVAATTGNDIYLSIDAELEKECYNIMEEHLSQIILEHFQNTNVKRTTSPINITTTEVFFALFDNNIVDIEHFSSKKASDTEKRIASAIASARQTKLKSVRTEILSTRTKQKTLSQENQEYMSYIYHMLYNSNIIKSSDIDSNDDTFQEWNNDDISLGEFLEYAVHMNWVDTSAFNLSTDYYDTDEMMAAMMDYIEEELLDDEDFSKLILENLIDTGVVSGKDCCMVLFDQGVLDSSKDSEYEGLVNGTLSAYSFMYKKIQKLEITPSQLALDPCAGSIVVTDTNTGKVKALVSYPSYDNNKLANNLDDDYYASLLADKTSPFLNRAMQSSTAPGSTFKMVSASAALTEGIVSTSEKINCTGIYDKIALSPKCSVYPSSHGKIGISKAIEVSCNIFFFEVGYRLSTKSDGTYDEDYGLNRLHSYAALFGLDQTSGIELDENAPQISTQDAVRSAIGQGNNSFTPSQLSRYVTTIANNGTCYNLSILDKQTDSDGKTIKEYEPSVLNEVDLSDTVWDAIHKGMYDVVHGTQHGDVFASMKTEVAGKTGTAEEDSTRASHALFVSYAPYDNPEISVTVVVPYGYSSSNAMEIAKDVYSYYFNEGNETEDKDSDETDSEDTETTEEQGDDDTTEDTAE